MWRDGAVGQVRPVLDAAPASAMLCRRTVLLGGSAVVAALAVPVLGRAQVPFGGAAASSKSQADPTLLPWRPTRMPVLDVVDLQTEQRRTLADFAGHALIVNFWATWCAPCRVEIPSLNALCDRLALRGLRLVAINHGEMPARVHQFVTETPIHGTVLLDRSQSQLRVWGARGLPASFVLDARGRPRYTAMGELDWLSPPVMAAVEAVLQG